MDEKINREKTVCFTGHRSEKLPKGDALERLRLRLADEIDKAKPAQEAARTGVSVVTTIHSNSCEATYRRMVSLCKRAVDMSDQTLMDYVTEAYPMHR